MPESVSEYAQSKRLDAVREIQLELLDAYERDFAKHAPLAEIMKKNPKVLDRLQPKGK